MGEFDEFPVRTIEQGKGLGAVFDGARFGVSGTQRHHVADQGVKLILPQFAFEPVSPRLRDHRVVLPQSIHGSLEP